MATHAGFWKGLWVHEGQQSWDSDGRVHSGLRILIHQETVETSIIISFHVSFEQTIHYLIQIDGQTQGITYVYDDVCEWMVMNGNGN